MTFVDTSAWYAVVMPDDAKHAHATRWFTANRAALLTTDYIVDETLTLLRARGQTARALSLGAALFADGLAVVRHVTRDDVLAAWGVFGRFSDKGWSFTDCVSKVVMRAEGITEAFAFDEHFWQFGDVLVVPTPQ